MKCEDGIIIIISRVCLCIACTPNFFIFFSFFQGYNMDYHNLGCQMDFFCHRINKQVIHRLSWLILFSRCSYNVHSDFLVDLLEQNSLVQYGGHSIAVK